MKPVIQGWLLFLLGFLFFLPPPLALAQPNENMLYFKSGYKGFNLGSGLNSTLTKSDLVRLKAIGFQLFRVNLKLNYNSQLGLFELKNLSELFLNKLHGDLESLGLKLIISVVPSKVDWLRPDFEKELSLFWQQIAQRYRLDKTVIAFDIINEPTPPLLSRIDNERLWRNIANSVIEGIRKIDNKIIVYEPAPWGLPEGFKWLKPVDFENIVYSFHMYSPHKFTHQGIRAHKKRVHYPSIKEGLDIKYLRRVIEPVIKFQKKYDVPIYVGEFSAIRYAPVKSRKRYIADLLKIWKENGWSWTYHSYKEWDGWDPEIISTNPKVKQRVFDSEIMKMLVEY